MSRAQLAPGHAREYETIYILRPNLDKDQANDVATRIADAIKGTEGMLTEAEFWGQRRLAYPIDRHHRGTYVYIKYLGRGETVSEIERQLRLVDTVIRYQTVQLAANVPLEGRATAEDVSIDYELDFQPDEPEQTYERELGLDAPPPERRRRDDRDRNKGDAAKSDGAKGDAAKGGDDAKAEAAKGGDDAKAEAAEGEKKADKADEAKADEAKADEAKADEAKSEKPGGES